MAGIIVDISIIKQLLQMHQFGYSNRRIAKDMELDKGTVNKYINAVEDGNMDINKLLITDDPVLVHKFNAGNPAYTDARMKTFLDELPMYIEKLGHKHVTRFLVWQEYKKMHPDGYGKSQFIFHLKQNLIAAKGPTAVLTDTYVPGQKLYVDFCGDRQFYCIEDLNKAVRELLDEHNRTRLQKRPYSREEHFHTIVKIYVNGLCVATHPRVYKWGYTTVKEHLASNNRAILERSPQYYMERAYKISHDFGLYVTELFSGKRSSNPPEIYYKTCNLLIGLHKKYDEDAFNATCRDSLVNKVFSGRQFEAILKHKTMYPCDVPNCDAPVPTNHNNMRGTNYYK